MAFNFIPVSMTALHGIGKADAEVGSAMLNTVAVAGTQVAGRPRHTSTASKAPPNSMGR